LSVYIITSFKKILRKGINGESLQQIINKFFHEIDSVHREIQDTAVDFLTLIILDEQSNSSWGVVNEMFPNLLKKLLYLKKEFFNLYVAKNNNNEFINKEKNKNKLNLLRKEEDELSLKENNMNINLIAFLKIMETFLQKYGNYSIVSVCYIQLIELFSAFQFFSDSNVRFIL
jgi:hypothetical protein